MWFCHLFQGTFAASHLIPFFVMQKNFILHLDHIVICFIWAGLGMAYRPVVWSFWSLKATIFQHYFLRSMVSKWQASKSAPLLCLQWSLLHLCFPQFGSVISACYPMSQVLTLNANSHNSNCCQSKYYILHHNIILYSWSSPLETTMWVGPAHFLNLHQMISKGGRTASVWKICN
jgi:hypothetical protein